MKQLNPNKINRSAAQWYFPLSYCSLVILTKTSRLPVLLFSRLSFCFQCDEIFLKHSKKYSKEFLLNKWLLQNIPQSLGLFGLLFKEYLLPKSLKNWPIWSHWSQRFGHTGLRSIDLVIPDRKSCWRPSSVNRETTAEWSRSSLISCSIWRNEVCVGPSGLGLSMADSLST